VNSPNALALPTPRQREIRGEGCGLAFLEFLDDVVRVKRHVDRVIFGDHLVRGQKVHGLGSLALVELASLDLDTLLRPVVAQPQELIEERGFSRGRDDKREHQ
jgi:hypothetical protein